MLLAKGRKLEEMTAAEMRVAKTVGGAREEGRAGRARW